MRRPNTLVALGILAAWQRRRRLVVLLLSWLGAVGLGWMARGTGCAENEHAEPEHAGPEHAGPDRRGPLARTDDALEAVMLEDRASLHAGQLVGVRARTAVPAVAISNALYAEVLVGQDWIAADAVAWHGGWDDPLAGWYLTYRGQDLDGDGSLDRLWHAVREGVEVDTERQRRDGYLVFESAGGARTLPLLFSDGWGSDIARVLAGAAPRSARDPPRRTHRGPPPPPPRGQLLLSFG